MNKVCLECGAPIVRDHIVKGWQRRGEIKRLTFCSRTCANRHTSRTRASTKYRHITTRGYVEIWKPDHPMAQKSGYLMEHRFLMAEHLGRMLEPGEVVHHKNGKLADNRLENLEVMSKSDHDRKPKPPVKPFPCPHCGGLIRVFISTSRVRTVVAVSDEGP
jgi:hypothetical protein